MAQKIIKIGTSAAITLSPDILRTLKVKVGDSVEVRANNTATSAAITPMKRLKSKSGVNRELIEWIDDAIKRYRPALEALADK